jgi:hypothetical protein
MKLSDAILLQKPIRRKNSMLRLRNDDLDADDWELSPCLHEPSFYVVNDEKTHQVESVKAVCRFCGIELGMTPQPSEDFL